MAHVWIQEGCGKEVVVLKNAGSHKLFYKGYRMGNSVLWKRVVKNGLVIYDRNWWCGTGLEARHLLPGQEIAMDIRREPFESEAVYGAMIYGRHDMVYWSDGTMTDEESCYMALRAQVKMLMELKKSAQQVDAAEPSTIAVPPYRPSGSAR